MCRLVCSRRVFFFVFKQKTAYEMRISDWSSDVCSSDLIVNRVAQAAERVDQPALLRLCAAPHAAAGDFVDLLHGAVARLGDAAGEVAVALLDHRLDPLPHFWGLRTGALEAAGDARGDPAVGVHTDVPQRLLAGRGDAAKA